MVWNACVIEKLQHRCYEILLFIQAGKDANDMEPLEYSAYGYHLEDDHINQEVQ